MNNLHKELIEKVKSKRKTKNMLTHIKVFGSIIVLYIVSYFLDKYHFNENIGLAMFFTAGIICFVVAIKNIILQKEIMAWNVVNCLILEKEYSTVPIIYFLYSVKDIEYVSYKLHINAESSSLFNNWKSVGEKYSIACVYKCYVNPKNAEQAVLERSFDKVYFYFYSFFGLFFWGCIVYYLLK